MLIKSTHEYLQTLDEIAEYTDKINLSISERRILNLKKLAVKKYELKEINKYPAVESLILDFNKSKHLLNQKFNAAAPIIPASFPREAFFISRSFV